MSYIATGDKHCLPLPLNYSPFPKEDYFTNIFLNHLPNNTSM